MDLENNVQAGETGNKRKSFLEKLGLIEPVENEDPGQTTMNNEKEDVPDSPQSIQSLFSDSKEPDKPSAVSDGLNAEPASDKGAPSDLGSSFSAVTDEPPAPQAVAKKDSHSSSYIADTDYQNAVQSQKNIQMLTVSEIYTLFNLKPAGDREAVYLAENFMHALPVNLPLEIKKDSLQKLFVASGINSETLISDGKERINTLERYLDSFTKDLEDVISYNENQVIELKEKIQQHAQVIAEKTRMIAEQKSMIKFETQRIADLLDSLDKGK